MLATGLLLVCGCGPSLPEQAVEPPPPPAVKQQLAEVAQSGELGSAATGIREALERYRESDPNVAEALLHDLDQLEGLSDPTRIRSMAQSMVDKL